MLPSAPTFPPEDFPPEDFPFPPGILTFSGRSVGVRGKLRVEMVVDICREFAMARLGDVDDVEEKAR